MILLKKGEIQIYRGRRPAKNLVLNSTNLGETAIVEKLAKEDPDWRIRYQAFEILTDGDSIQTRC